MRKETKQHTLWLLAAASAPIAHFSGCGWFSAMLAAVVALPLILVPKCWDSMPKLLGWVQLLWLAAVAGLLLKNSAAYWPSDNALAVPLTLLTLAALTGEKSAPRIGAVLAFCTALLAIPFAVSGAAHLEPDWMKWTPAPWPAMLSLVLLFPALPGAGERKKSAQGVWTGLLAAALALLVQGTISPQVAGSLTDPFYQTARTLGYLEPIAAVGMTLGWYAMAVFVLNSGKQIAKSSNINGRIALVFAIGTATAALLIRLELNAWFCAETSLFLWVLAPFLNRKINLKKDEKRC